jgi:hypothetical protein
VEILTNMHAPFKILCSFIMFAWFWFAISDEIAQKRQIIVRRDRERSKLACGRETEIPAMCASKLLSPMATIRSCAVQNIVYAGRRAHSGVHRSHLQFAHSANSTRKGPLYFKPRKLSYINVFKI